MKAIWTTNPSTLRDNTISVSLERFHSISTCMTIQTVCCYSQSGYKNVETRNRSTLNNPVISDFY